jgi:hypothetical protein
LHNLGIDNADLLSRAAELDRIGEQLVTDAYLGGAPGGRTALQRGAVLEPPREDVMDTAPRRERIREKEAGQREP